MELTDLQSQVEPPDTRRGILAALIALYAAVVVRTAWISHDAFITLRTVDNVLRGYGPVWNVGERVQAYTHPLWLALLTTASLMTGEYYYTTIFLSLALALIAIWLLATRIAVTLTGAIAAILILTASKAFVEYSTSGLENPLLHLLLVLFFIQFFSDDRESLWPLFRLALLTGLIMLTRLDAVLLVGPALLWFWWPRRWLRGIGVVIVGLLPVVIWELFSLFYYGFPFPNTAYAKLNAGIESARLAQQGLFYAMRLVDIDPLTAVVIIMGVILPFISRSWRRGVIAAGIILYLLYVVRIGGDFMAGRFFAAPLLCAVIIISRVRLGSAGRPSSLLIFAAIVVVGLFSPNQSPLLANSSYRTDGGNNKQIEDMRGHHFWDWGLLRANETNRLGVSGRIDGSAITQPYQTCVGMGPGELMVGPHVFVLDTCALTDPLLARLPAINSSGLFAGHYFRHVPDGYMTTLRTGENQLQDGDLADYYDKLAHITRGDLWDMARMVEIVRFNLGQYDHLIDQTQYRYPRMLTLDAESLSKARLDELGGHPSPVAGAVSDGAYMIGASGAQINFGSPRHEQYIELGYNGSYFDLQFLRDDAIVADQTVSAYYARLGADYFTIVTVPPEAAETGYTALRLISKEPGAPELVYLELIDADAELLPLEQLLHLYTYAYLRADKASRADLLAWTQARIAQVTAEEWAGIDARKRVDLLHNATPSIRNAADSSLANIRLVDESGAPIMRYLGVDGQQALSADLDTPEGQEPDWRSALELRLFFEGLEPASRPYSAWFHIVSNTDDRQYMIYDRFPDQPLTAWSLESLQEFMVSIFLDPGEYDISFGFWTPGDRQRLYQEGTDDIYWVNLGTFEIHE